VRIELFAVLLMDHCDHYQELYAAVVEYYGENPRTLPPSTFFSLFVRFVKAFKVCDIVATCIDDLSFLHQPTTADGVFFWPLTLQRLFLCCDPPPLPPPVHIWDVMYVWRKGNIEKNCLCVTILCTIIMVHKGTSSSYRSIDCIGLWSCVWFSSLSSERLCVFGLHGAIYIISIYIYIFFLIFAYILVFTF